MADSSVTEAKLSARASGSIWKGAVAVQTISFAALKALLTAAAAIEVFPVKAGDIILKVTVHVSAGSTAVCNLNIGLNAAARGAAADATSIMTATAINGGVTRILDSASAAIGSDVYTGFFEVQGDGYVIMGSSADLTADGAIKVGMTLYYLPA